MSWLSLQELLRALRYPTRPVLGSGVEIWGDRLGVSSVYIFIRLYIK